MVKVNLNEKARALLPEYLRKFIDAGMYEKEDVKRIIKFHILKKKNHDILCHLNNIKKDLVQKKIRYVHMSHIFKKIGKEWVKVNKLLDHEHLWMDNLIENTKYSLMSKEKVVTDFTYCERCTKPKPHTMSRICVQCMKEIRKQGKDSPERKKYMPTYYHECQMCGKSKPKSKYPFCNGCGKRYNRIRQATKKYYHSSTVCGKKYKKQSVSKMCWDCYKKSLENKRLLKKQDPKTYLCPICEKTRISFKNIICWDCKEKFKHRPKKYTNCLSCNKDLEKAKQSTQYPYCKNCADTIVWAKKANEIVHDQRERYGIDKESNITGS